MLGKVTVDQHLIILKMYSKGDIPSTFRKPNGPLSNYGPSS